MEEFNMDEFNNLSTDDQWLFLTMLLLLSEADKKTDAQIQQFENDLIYKNRFSSKSAVVDEIHSHKKESTIIVPTGKTYYRARVFKDFSIDKLVKYYLQELGKTDEQIKEILKTWNKTQKVNALSNAQFFASNDGQRKYSTEQIAIRNAQLKWRKSVKYKGYGARDSTAPEPDQVKNGRANPDHIRYLYVCEDQDWLRMSNYTTLHCQSNRLRINRLNLSSSMLRPNCLELLAQCFLDHSMEILLNISLHNF